MTFFAPLRAALLLSLTLLLLRIHAEDAPDKWADSRLRETPGVGRTAGEAGAKGRARTLLTRNE